MGGRLVVIPDVLANKISGKSVNRGFLHPPTTTTTKMTSIETAYTGYNMPQQQQAEAPSAYAQCSSGTCGGGSSAEAVPFVQESVDVEVSSTSDLGSYEQSTGDMIEEPFDDARRYINTPHRQGEGVRNTFDFLADINIAIRTNPKSAFLIGFIGSLLVLLIFGAILCIGGRLTNIAFFRSFGACGSRLTLTAIVLALLLGIGFWIRASLFQGNRRKFLREGMPADQAYQTSILLTPLMPPGPI